MNAEKNATFLPAAAALGVAAVTGVIGWTFAHVFELSTSISELKADHISDREHDVLQDKWIDEINRKLEANRDAIAQLHDSLNRLGARRDGKNVP